MGNFLVGIGEELICLKAHLERLRGRRVVAGKCPARVSEKKLVACEGVCEEARGGVENFCGGGNSGAGLSVRMHAIGCRSRIFSKFAGAMD